jgi:hypothetical protein
MTTGFVIRAEGPGSIMGQLLQYYDPEIKDPKDPRRTGYAKWTNDPLMAIVYKTRQEALKEWMRVSVSVPLRPDGKPNRPLSAFTVTIMTLEDALKDALKEALREDEERRER